MGAAVGLIDRNQVGDVAHHEQFARAGIENHFRRDAGIAAADDHDGGGLAALGKFPIAGLFGRKPLRGEGPVAVEQVLRKGCHGCCLCWSMPNHMPVTGTRLSGNGARWYRVGLENPLEETSP